MKFSIFKHKLLLKQKNTKIYIIFNKKYYFLLNVYIFNHLLLAELYDIFIKKKIKIFFIQQANHNNNNFNYLNINPEIENFFSIIDKHNINISSLNQIHKNILFDITINNVTDYKIIIPKPILKKNIEKLFICLNKIQILIYKIIEQKNITYIVNKITKILEPIKHHKIIFFIKNMIIKKIIKKNFLSHYKITYHIIDNFFYQKNIKLNLELILTDYKI